MDEFFRKPILNSPYEYPRGHWELDETGQPTNRILDERRRVALITPIPAPRKRRGQRQLVFDKQAEELETDGQQYDPTPIINDLRRIVDAWRELPANQWHVTPETARLLHHWRHHSTDGIRPFFCQVEAVETAIWLAEVAPRSATGRRFLDHLRSANEQANPGLERLALKLATGAGKTTVMAMLIAWQTINAVRHPTSPRFTRGFLMVTPGLTIRDRLRVLQPNDPDSYYRSRELVPKDLLGVLDRAKIVITNFHAFMLRETLELSMLTEGWDARTVTHVLGVRAFGTQLLCEQVVGRALRRQSYDLNEDGLFDVEYADVLGIPFDFTAKPVVVPPQRPRQTVQVKAITPDRDACEIRFPRVQGYRVELPEEHVDTAFDESSTFVLTPEIVGPSITHNTGIIGEGVDLDLIHRNGVRTSELVYHLTRTLMEQWREPNQEPKLHLFGQLKRIARRWLSDHLICKDGTNPAQLMYQELADRACKRITRAIVSRHLGEREVRAVLDPYNSAGSTIHVNFTTSKQTRWETDPRRCHINWVVCDSDWEAEFCRVVESHERVRSYVKNYGLGLEVPYRSGSEARTYLPDFVVLVDDGHGEDDLLRLVVEIKGFRREDAKEKKATMETDWVPGVNRLGAFGRWAFAEFTDVYTILDDFRAAVGAQARAQFDERIEGFLEDTRKKAATWLAAAGGSEPELEYVARRRSEPSE